MAKKMQLDSLLGNGKSSGIKKIEERSRESNKSHSKNGKKSKEEKEVIKSSVHKGKRGRPKVYTDPRYVSSEPARISVNVKIKLQSLTDQKFDGYTQSQIIDELIVYYIEHELPKEERIFFHRLVDKEMEDVKSSKKYRKYFE